MQPCTRNPSPQVIVTDPVITQVPENTARLHEAEQKKGEIIMDKAKERSEEFIQYKSRINFTEFKKSLPSLLCGEKYQDFMDDVDLVINQKCFLLTVVGEPGISKTTIIKEMLQEKGKVEGVDFEIISGFITPKALHKTLQDYKEKGQVIIFDDCDEVFHNSRSAEILKPAADDKEHRRVTYKSTKGHEDADDAFYFKGGIIIITNKHLTKRNAALKDRGFYQELFLNLSEKLEYIEKLIIPSDNKESNEEERWHVFHELKKACLSSDIDLTFRTYLRLVKKYHHSPRSLSYSINNLKKKQSSLGTLIETLHENRGERDKRLFKIFHEKSKDLIDKPNGIQERQFHNLKKQARQKLGAQAMKWLQEAPYMGLEKQQFETI